MGSCPRGQEADCNPVHTSSNLVEPSIMEGWPRGLRLLRANQLSVTAPWVRIPYLPPPAVVGLMVDLLLGKQVDQVRFLASAPTCCSRFLVESHGVTYRCRRVRSSWAAPTRSLRLLVGSLLCNEWETVRFCQGPPMPLPVVRSSPSYGGVYGSKPCGGSNNDQPAESTRHPVMR